MIIGIITAALIIAARLLLVKNEKIGGNKLTKSLLNAICIILLCEIFVFNAATFRTVFTKSEFKNITLENAVTENLTVEDGSLKAITPGKCTIEFPEVGCEVDTIHFNIASTKKLVTVKEFHIAYTDELSPELRENSCQINYIDGNEYSEYIACSFSGPVKNMKFTFDLYSGEEIAIDSVVVNETIPLKISPLRIFLLMLLILPIVAVMNFKKRDEKTDIKLLKRVCIAVAAVYAVIPIIISFSQSPSIAEDFKDPYCNQLNYELVNAFKQGKLSLDEVPDPRLAELENPYDRSLHGEIPSLWDHLYFNGKYYSYYGIAPVLTLFLPYNLITGNYFPCLWACCIYSCIGLIFLAMTYFMLVKRYFPNISNGMSIFGLLITMPISEIWYETAFDNFYETAQSSSFAAVAAGAYFLLASNTAGEGKISLKKACLSSVMLSLAVLCRPTTAVYCLAALVFIWFGAKKVKSDKKELTKYLCAALLPFVIIGSVQMIYNALRFGSPFDFGIQYSFTINDFTKTQFHLPFVFICFYNYLFAAPLILPRTPFIFQNFSNLSVNGFFYYNSIFSVGLLFKALPIFGWLLAGKAWKYSKKNLPAALMTFAACFAAPCIIIASIWESGYATRYTPDFSWQLLFGGLVIFFTLYSASQSQTAKKLMTRFFALSSVVAVTAVAACATEYIYFACDVAPHKAQIASILNLFDFLNIF